MSEDDVFNRVEIGTLDETPGSPVVDIESFRGIRIAMPRSLRVAQEEAVPICGTWVLPDEFLFRIKNVPDSLVFLIRNKETHAAVSGHFRFHEEEAQLPPEEAPPRGAYIPDDEDPEAVTMGWFNLDLQQSWRVPSTPGNYRLHIVLGTYQSNEMEFEVLEPPP